MTLTVGTRLGPYDVTGSIGAGGMGEVYRARDTRLQREVALKVLPAWAVDDADRRARFALEAQLLASLNHPHIGAIYGIEESGGTSALVLELVDGPTLADWTARGPLPLPDALSIAQQVAEALEAAHERGIVHRDLKPANIKVSADLRVKVLDFGIAKAVEQTPKGSIDPSDSPTMLSSATRSGIVLGTAGYMAPEQARGLDVDKRVDIWAFGCVLYEMLTGRPIFQGETTTDVLVSVLNAPIDWSALPANTPPAVGRLLARCLERDRRRRLRDIGDARIEIESLRGPEAESGPAAFDARAIPPAAARRPAWKIRGPILLLLAILAILAILAASGWWISARQARTTPSQAGPVTFTIAPPSGRDFTGDGTDLNPDFAVAPDGRAIVFTTEDEAGNRDLWVRTLGVLAARRLPGTEGGQWPFWSPDGRSVAFFVNGTISRVPVEGGQVQVVCSLSGNHSSHATWGASGTMLFGEAPGIMSVPADGGTPHPVTHPDSRTEYAHRDPVFLPDGRHFLYVSYTFDPTRRGVYLASLDGGRAALLVRSAARAEYLAPGYVAFVRGRSLVAQALDLSHERLSGDVVRLIDAMAVEPIPGHACYTISPAGVLAYRSMDRSVRSQLEWRDRTGRVIQVVGQGADVDVSLSHDGRRAAVSRITPGVESEARPPTNIWILDLERHLSTRWTLEATEGDEAPVWSPDGSELLFAAHPAGGTFAEVRRQPLNRPGPGTPFLTGKENFHPIDWSADGQHVLLHGGGLEPGDLNVWTVAARGGTPEPFARGAAEEAQARFSPDGHWVVFVSNESGRREVYVRPFPVGDERWQVSANGGAQPLWRGDGREIVYVAPDGTIVAVPVKIAGNSFSPGLPAALFREPSLRMNNSPFFYGGGAGYAVSADGRRILVNRMTHEPRPDPITVVVNPNLTR